MNVAVSSARDSTRDRLAIAVCLFCGVNAAEFHERNSSGLLNRHSRTDVLCNVQLQIALEFLGQVLFALMLVEQALQTDEQRAKWPDHEEAFEADKKRSRISVVRPHSRVSR